MLTRKLIFIASMLFCSACDGITEEQSTQASADYAPEELLGQTVDQYQASQAERDAKYAEDEKKLAELEQQGFGKIDWDILIAPGYDLETVFAKYEPMIDEIPHGSDGAYELLQKIEDELANAPPNPELADKKVSIPGFIAPLEQSGGIVTEFLLVPYFGACIHLPPPPANQTVHVKVAPENGIDLEESYNPIWVSGTLVLDTNKTDIGTASYRISSAIISSYQ